MYITIFNIIEWNNIIIFVKVTGVTEVTFYLNFEEKEISIIFDRFHLSDFTYGCFERKYSSTDALENFVNIEHALRDYSDSCGGVIEILVRPTDIKRSSREHGKDLTIYDADMFYMMDMFVNESKNKCTFICNYDTMDYIVHEIQIAIEENEGGFYV